MSEFLYNLLPALYRDLDRAEGYPLRALLALMDDERENLDREIGQLYADWFAETCSDEALPEVASLLGLPTLLTRRAAVANALACGRRKGTFAALERRIADTSGWLALATIDLLPADPASADATPTQQLGVLATVWRQPSSPVERATPYAFGNGCYTFHPMGLSIPLFHFPAANYDLSRPMSLQNMPTRLGLDSTAELLSPTSVALAGSDSELPIQLADLSHWKSSSRRPDDPLSQPVLVDPVLGRFQLPPQMLPKAGPQPDLAVSYAYALSADVGGGPYPRTTGQPTALQAGPWTAYVQSGTPASLAPQMIFPTFEKALAAFRESPCQGTILFLDSATYDLPPGTLDTAGWVCPSAPQDGRRLILKAIDGQVPCLRGDLRITAVGLPLSLTLDGLWFDGAIQPGGLLTLEVRDCTVRPTSPGDPPGALRGILAQPGEQSCLSVLLTRSISGPVQLPRGCGGFSALGSIIESIAAITRSGESQPDALPGAAFPLTLTDTTVLLEITGVEPIAVHSLYGLPPSDYASIIYGDPNYARLRSDVEDTTRCGNETSEAGAFRQAEQHLRCRQMSAALEEYVPAEVPAGFRFAT